VVAFALECFSLRAFSLKYTRREGEEERERTFSMPNRRRALEAPFCYMRAWRSEGHVR